MKAIIEISQRGAVKARALSGAHTLDRGGRVSGDFRPGFETAAQLFSELTPARMALLESLKALAPVSIYALAKEVRRNYSNVHHDCAALEGHGLIEKDAARRHRPWANWPAQQGHRRHNWHQTGTAPKTKPILISK